MVVEDEEQVKVKSWVMELIVLVEVTAAEAAMEVVVMDKEKVVAVKDKPEFAEMEVVIL